MEEMWRQFYSCVVPRIREETLFGNVGVAARLELDSSSREAMITLYHSILEWTTRGICKAISKLLADGILDGKGNSSEYETRRIFKFFCNSCMQQNFEYFVTMRTHLEFVRSQLSDIIYETVFSENN